MWQDHPGVLAMGRAKRAAFDGGQGLGNTLAGWNRRDNGAGIAARAEGLVSQAQQRSLSSS